MLITRLFLAYVEAEQAFARVRNGLDVYPGVRENRVPKSPAFGVALQDFLTKEVAVLGLLTDQLLADETAQNVVARLREEIVQISAEPSKALDLHKTLREVIAELLRERPARDWSELFER